MRLLLVILLLFGSAINTDGLVINTPNKYHYQQPGIGNIAKTTSAVFKVQACNDAHVLLMGRRNDYKNDIYEIVIGGWSNTQSVIRKRQQGRHLATARHRPLDCRTSKSFWVSWDHNTIRVGTGLSVGSGEFMFYADPRPTPVVSLGVSTGWGATGKWTFDDDECINAPCLNGATCKNLFTGYKCECTPLFTGTNCEQAAPCHGKTKRVDCSSHGFAYKECKVPGAKKIIWATVHNKMSRSKCNFHDGPAPANYGRERDGIYGFSDIIWVHSGCRAKFDVCYTESESCDPNPCGNGGSCEPSASGYICKCQFGWSGQHCTERDVCECTASGDPHYFTFDKQVIHFQGTCVYKLAEAWRGTCGMVVHVKNIQSQRNPRVSFTRKMIVLIDDDKIVIGRNRIIKINGTVHTFPFSTTSYTISKHGQYIVVENTCNMKAMFNGATTAKVIINKEDGEGATGICGNCNAEPDDYRLKNGTDVSGERNKFSLIGNSYVIEEEGETDPSCTKEDEDIICTVDINEQIAQNDFCGYILDTSGPFKDCLDMVPAAVAQSFFDFCAYDVCANWGNAMAQVCSNLETFMDYCATMGAEVINFRTADFCAPDCGDNMVYNPFVTELQPSCKDRSPSSGTSFPPVTGCVCADGYILDNAKETCIIEDDCGCSTEDNYYPIGGSFLNENCNVNYTCSYDGAVSFLNEEILPGCDDHEECTAVEGVRRCICKDGYERIDGICMEPCLGKVKTVSCDSWEFSYQECPVGDADDVITAAWVAGLRYSSSLCQFYDGEYEDFDGPPGIFGFKRNIVWVFDGCKADFKVCLVTLPPPPPHVTTEAIETTPAEPGTCDGDLMTVDCDSIEFKYQACPIGDEQTIIKSVKLIDRRSNSLCKFYEGYYKNFTGPPGIFGFNKNVFWVYKGCRGKFEVCYSDDICKRIKPCKNGGSCTNKGQGRYECCCPQGWNGKHCNKEDLPPKPPGPHLECINDLADDPKGLMYFGTRDVTTSGRKCQPWSSRQPHQHAYHKSLAEEENFCRNRLHGKKGRHGPWCFTMDPDKKWEYCDNIPLCSYPNTTFPTPPANPGCFNRSDRGEGYVGPVDFSATGKRCETWQSYPDNYCRNPYGIKSRPWCWTKDGKEDCAIQICALPPPVPNENVCTVDTSTSLCESVMILSGDCYFRHRLYQECDFTIVRVDTNVHDVYMPGSVQELHWQGDGGPERHTNTACHVTFEVTGPGELTVKYPICGWCAKLSYESFMNDILNGSKTCPAP